MMDITLEGSVPAEGATEAAARGGDRGAWTELIARHNRRVMLSLLAHGVLPAQAKEMAQEAWLRLITQADAKKLLRLELPGLAIRQALRRTKLLQCVEAREALLIGLHQLDLHV